MALCLLQRRWAEKQYTSGKITLLIAVLLWFTCRWFGLAYSCSVNQSSITKYVCSKINIYTALLLQFGGLVKLNPSTFWSPWRQAGNVAIHAPNIQYVGPGVDVRQSCSTLLYTTLLAIRTWYIPHCCCVHEETLSPCRNTLNVKHSSSSVGR